MRPWWLTLALSLSLPLPLARPYLDAGRLVAKPVSQPQRNIRVGYVWRAGSGEGRALAWWLDHLSQDTTRQALLSLAPPCA